MNLNNVKLPTELLEYMLNENKMIFVDDFSGWGEQAVPQGFHLVPAMEGNALKSKDDETFSFQCTSMRRGNHLTVQLRDYDQKTTKKLELGTLPLFKNFEVVIWTNCERLIGFAPICRNKLELAIFLQNLEEYGSTDYRWNQTKAEMASLAKWLYKHNPEKTKSILDNLDVD